MNQLLDQATELKAAVNNDINAATDRLEKAAAAGEDPQALQSELESLYAKLDSAEGQFAKLQGEIEEVCNPVLLLTHTV